MNRLTRVFAKSNLKYWILIIVLSLTANFIHYYYPRIWKMFEADAKRDEAAHGSEEPSCACSQINLLTDPSVVIDYDQDSVAVNLSIPSYLTTVNESRQDRNHVILVSESKDEAGSAEQTSVARGGRNETSLTPCPRRPPDLIGPVQLEPKGMSLGQLVKRFPSVEVGGRVRPRDCIARQRLAVIVPYRNRWPHLRYFLQHLIPFLTRQQVDARFFIIEQEAGWTFNRGALLNIGFLEALKLGQFDCFVFHDVDLLPLNDKNLYRCGDNPRHLAVAINKYSFTLPYSSYFGGVVMFTKQQYLDINGNSNLYVGWGGEDDDLMRRVMNKGYYISRYAIGISNYDMFQHGRDKGNEENPLRGSALRTATARQHDEGLNTLVYQVHGVHLRHLYTHVMVQINNTQLLQDAPAYVRQEMTSQRPSSEPLVTDKPASE